MISRTAEAMSHLDWSNRVIFVTGASRGIGAAFGRMAASLGARVVLASRSVDAPSHDGLSGSLMDVKNDIDRLGGSAHIMHLDTRDEARIRTVANEIVTRWGRLDLLVNNASAIDLRRIPPVKVADLVHSVNCRGTMLLNQAFLPVLKESDGQILTISPPLEDWQTWSRVAPAYVASKYGMTLHTIGLSHEVKANCLWPKRTIATAATRMLERNTGVAYHSKGRKPSYFAQAMVDIVDLRETGQTCFDEDILPHPPDDAPLDMFVNHA